MRALVQFSSLPCLAGSRWIILCDGSSFNWPNWYSPGYGGFNDIFCVRGSGDMWAVHIGANKPWLAGIPIWSFFMILTRVTVTAKNWIYVF